MARFARVDKERRCPGRGQRRRHLAADVAALAHAHDDDATATGEDGAEGGDEALALARLQRIECARFDVERRTRQRKRAFGVEGG